MKYDTLGDKLGRLHQYVKDVMDEYLVIREPSHAYYDREEYPCSTRSKYRPDIGNYLIPKDSFHIVGNIQVTCPSESKVQLYIDHNVVWEGTTKAEEPLKIPMTLNMRKLADHTAKIVVHSPLSRRVRLTGRFFHHPDDRDLVCSYRPKWKSWWFEAQTPRGWQLFFHKKESL